MNKDEERRVVLKLKDEIKQKHHEKKLERTTLTKKQTKCINAFTEIEYDFSIGSVEESQLYRVMPLNGTEKLYFDTEGEYKSWSRSQRVRNKMYNPTALLI